MQTVLTVNNGRIERVMKVQEQPKKKFNLIKGLAKVSVAGFNGFNEYFGLNSISDKVWFHGFVWFGFVAVAFSLYMKSLI